jgi:CheY-like chemotaxis protein
VDRGSRAGETQVKSAADDLTRSTPRARASSSVTIEGENRVIAYDDGSVPRDPGYALFVGSILLVEADSEECNRWSTALSAEGHSVLAATVMRDALSLIQEGGIDVVVIDAYEQCVGVIDLARNIDALPDAPPIVLVSGSPVAPEVSARIGAAHFLPKPCEPEELVEIVSRLLGRLRPVRIVDDEPTGPTRQYG